MTSRTRAGSRVESGSVQHAAPSSPSVMSSAVTVGSSRGGPAANGTAFKPAKTHKEWYERLVEGEGEYLELLVSLRDQFVKPIKADSKITKPVLFNRADHQKLAVFLSSVEALVTLNSKFGEEVRARGEDDVGKVFEQYAPLFQMYGQYAGDYSAAVELFSSQLDGNEKFATFVKNLESSVGCELMKMIEAPLVRIYVYLADLESLMSIDSPASRSVSLKAAKEELERTIGHVHKNLNATAKLDRLKQLQRDWIGGNLMAGSISKTRTFVMEGDLEKMSRKQLVKCRFLLFSDGLAYGLPLGGGKVRFKRMLGLAKMVIEDSADENEDIRSRSFNILTPTKSFKVTAESTEAKLNWMSELNANIVTARELAPTSVQDSAESDDLQPLWAPDVSSKSCTKCSQPFTMVRRRHHCRRCGTLVCAPCSRSRMTRTVASAKDSTKVKQTKVRVCDDCANTKGENVTFREASYASSDDEDKRRESQPSDEDDDYDLDDMSNSKEIGALECECVEPRPQASIDNPDELELEIGDVVTIEEIVGGWALGTNSRSGGYGYMPASFLVLRSDQSELPNEYSGSAHMSPVSTLDANQHDRSAPSHDSDPKRRASVSSESKRASWALSSPKSIGRTRSLSISRDLSLEAQAILGHHQKKESFSSVDYADRRDRKSVV